MTVTARIIRIGNSRGLRLSRAVLDQCGIDDVVELEVERGRLVVRPIGNPRAGWAEDARDAAASGEGPLLDEPTPTRFDLEDWVWE